MKINLVFVPPGGGEADHSLPFDMPSVPNPGDYISITREGDEAAGQSNFIVRRTWWVLSSPETRAFHSTGDERVGSVQEIAVECEFALAPYSSEEHKGSVSMYDSRGKGTLKFDNSMY